MFVRIIVVLTRLFSTDEPGALSRATIERALLRLGELAADAGEHVSLVVVGGTALVLGYNARPATRDVDAYLIVPPEREPDEAGLMNVYCTILVERDSQKSIVVGKQGSMIKAIGTAARLELEKFFACRLYLDLHVKVKSEWRNDERVLDDLGVRGRNR